MINKINRISSQRGVASIILILLVSLAITATSTGVIQTMRKNQEVSIATNAITHAETGMWAGAEAFRIYLQSINQLSLIGLGTQDLAIEMDSSYGSLAAESINVVPMGGHLYRVSATIVNEHAAARSTSSLEVVYEVDSNGGTPDPKPPSVNFNDSLNINGGIELTNNGEPVDLVVDGDVVLGGVSVNPINQISATGRIELNSSVTVNKIYSEDEVELNSSNVTIVEAMGKVTTSGSTSVDEIWSNDNVNINSSGEYQKIYSRKKITIKGGGKHGLLNAVETVTIQNASSVDAVESIGNVGITGWGPTVHSVITEGNITCPSPWWQKTSLLSANGTVNNCPSSNGSRTVEEGVANVVATMAPITSRTFSAENIDVWELKDSANYFVWHDGGTNDIKVTVNGIAGISDGSILTLGDYSASGKKTSPFYDYLCETVNSAGICTAPATPSIPLCFGESLSNRCISYDTSSKTFTINPNQTAPGVIFFDGNVVLENGHGVSTILASGNIATAGSFEHWAVNFGAFEKICQANADHIDSKARARYTSGFSTHYPTALCDMTESEYVPAQIGNIGLAAGGINPDLTINPAAAYTGGDITLGSSTEIVGAVLAGNVFETGGQTTINGTVSAGSYGEIGGDHSLGGKTTIDFSTTEDFDGNDVPTTGSTPSTSAIPVASILWARTL